MEITQDKIDLISKLIKNNRKYSGNEDLFEDFLNETCHRSVAIINAIDNESTLEAYLRKIVISSILQVLRDSGRLRRTRTGYMTTKELPLETVTEAPEIIATVAPTPVPEPEKPDCSSYVVDYASLNVPITPEQNAINNEVLDFVADTIEKIDIEMPEEQYMNLFIMRYDKGMTQKEIASELGISQSEVSKRLYGLVNKVKNVLNEQ